MTSTLLDISLTGFDDVFGSARGAKPELAGTALERLQALGVVDMSEFADMFGDGIDMESAEENLPAISSKLGLEISVLWFSGDPEIDDDCNWWLAHRGEEDDIAWLPDDFVDVVLRMKPENTLIDFAKSEACKYFYRICPGNPLNLVSTGKRA